jgi:hypothetical protein
MDPGAGVLHSVIDQLRVPDGAVPAAGWAQLQTAYWTQVTLAQGKRHTPHDFTDDGHPADPEKTQLVNPATPPAAAHGPARVAPGAEDKTMRVNSQRPPTPPPPAPAPPGPQPHHAPPPPRTSYGPTGATRTPPPYGGPGAPVPPPGYGPGVPTSPPPHQWPGAPTSPHNPYNAYSAQNPRDAANEMLAKGKSLISRLMLRGIRGELIRQPWFQNLRRQSADQFVYITYAVGFVLSLVLALAPGVIGTIITDMIWAGMIFVFFAVGTKLAHQFVAYGICAVGTVLAVIGALYTITTFIDLASLHYFAGTTIMLVFSLAVTVISGAALAYIRVQVHREIQRMSAT